MDRHKQEEWGPSFGPALLCLVFATAAWLYAWHQAEPLRTTLRSFTATLNPQIPDEQIFEFTVGSDNEYFVTPVFSPPLSLEEIGLLYTVGPPVRCSVVPKSGILPVAPGSEFCARFRGEPGVSYQLKAKMTQKVLLSGRNAKMELLVSVAPTAYKNAYLYPSLISLAAYAFVFLAALAALPPLLIFFRRRQEAV